MEEPEDVEHNPNLMMVRSNSVKFMNFQRKRLSSAYMVECDFAQPGPSLSSSVTQIREVKADQSKGEAVQP